MFDEIQDNRSGQWFYKKFIKILTNELNVRSEFLKGIFLIANIQIERKEFTLIVLFLIDFTLESSIKEAFYTLNNWLYYILNWFNSMW